MVEQCKMQLSREAPMTDDKPRPLPKGLSLPNPKTSPAAKLAFAKALDMAADSQDDPGLREAAKRLRRVGLRDQLLQSMKI